MALLFRSTVENGCQAHWLSLGQGLRVFAAMVDHPLQFL